MTINMKKLIFILMMLPLFTLGQMSAARKLLLLQSEINLKYGLTFVWELEEIANSSTATDAAGNYNGTYDHNNDFISYRVQGILDYGISITGQNDGVFTNSYVNSDSYSVSCWVKASTSVDENLQYLWLLSNEGLAITPAGFPYTSTSVKFHFRHGGTVTYATTVGVHDLSSWTNIVLLRSLGNDVKIYIDGEYFGYWDLDSAIGSLSNGGFYSGGYQLYPEALVSYDQFAKWGRNLSDEEILYLNNNGVGRRYTSW